MIKIAEQLMFDYCKAYEKRDLEATLKLFTKNATVWGTGKDEYRVGLDQIAEQHKRDWSQSESASIHCHTFVETPNDALWAASICDAVVVVAGVEYKLSDLRGTIAIALEENVWKIVHMHASFPDPRNSEGNSFPIEE